MRHPGGTHRTAPMFVNRNHSEWEMLSAFVVRAVLQTSPHCVLACWLLGVKKPQLGCRCIVHCEASQCA